LPNIKFLPPYAGYAQVLTSGFDYFEETWDVTLARDTMNRLEDAKAEARELDGRGKMTVPIELAGDTYQVRSYGTSGTPILFGDDDLLFMVRPRDMPWHVSVRYLAAGLWEHGVDALRERVAAVLDGYGDAGGHPARVRRFDYAFDVYSPDFTAEMVPSITRRFVLPSGVKFGTYGEIFGTPEKVETLTIGIRKATLSIQIYDKGKEIREASGKTWMLDLWERDSTWRRPPRDEPVRHVWRVELRFQRDWLKHRRVDCHADINEGALREIIGEALMTRRLTVPDRENHRERWPLAPLWTLLLNQHPTDRMRPLGKRYTHRADEIASMCIDMANGTLRTAEVLKGVASDSVYEEAQLRSAQDRSRPAKLERTRRRYAGVNEAR
jgi:hypothetical protein